jgi:GTP-binding protein HflX
MLFATLDPTMRGIRLPSGRPIVMSDTVGFIADLPHELIAAFRATLEEVLEADVIIHVRDIAHEETEAQKADVLNVLAELGIESDGDRRMLEVFNKIDLLSPEERAGLKSRNGSLTAPVAISALTGEGISDLLQRLDRLLDSQSLTLELRLAPDDGAGLAWAYSHGRVLTRKNRNDGIQLTLAIEPADQGRFEKRFGEHLK